MKFSLGFIVCIIWFCALSVHAETLTVGSAESQPGQTVLLPITVDNPGNIAGAVFTLTYNSSYLILTAITSTFFDTFTNQWQTLDPVPDPLPPGQVTVDEQDYSQPLLFNNQTNKTLVAAARVKSGATETTMFTLHFTVGTNVPNGTYPVSISQTSINNTAAGFDPAGDYLPILIGAVEGETDLSLAYPALAVNTENGSISINATVNDTDGDGIADSWEMSYFGNLTTANKTSDYDKDGYTDLQEYLNSIANEQDPAQNDYDPKVQNAPGGTGYNINSGSGSFWNLVLPAIINSTSK